MGFNSLTISGNLGRDSETRYLSSGSAIVQFSVPATSGYGDKQKTTWIRCNWFGDRAVKVSEYLKKGTGVIVQGEFSMNTYTSKDGIEKSSPELNVRELTLIGGKNTHGEDAPSQASHRDGGAAPLNPARDIQDIDSDIPF